MCDKCVNKYFLESSTSCIDGTCLIENCADCSVGGPTTCQACEIGFEWDPLDNVCVDVTCKLNHCSDCSQSGIWGCDQCADGYFFDAGVTNECLDMTCKVDECA